MRNYIRRICIFLLAIPALTSCAGSPDCFHQNVFCAALVTDTPGINDHGINQDTWAGLQQAKSDGLVENIALMASIDARDYEKNIAYLAQNGYDVIITTGTGLRDETLRAANQFSDSVFIGMNQPLEQTLPNLIPITFPEDQMGFFAGSLAAHLTKTGIIGAVIARLGFSIAINLDPEILLIVEILSVGDLRFQLKCNDKIDEFRRRRVTMVIVSHSTEQIQRLCDRVIWLADGQVIEDGLAEHILPQYTKMMSAPEICGGSKAEVYSSLE